MKNSGRKVTVENVGEFVLNRLYRFATLLLPRKCLSNYSSNAFERELVNSKDRWVRVAIKNREHDGRQKSDQDWEGAGFISARIAI